MGRGVGGWMDGMAWGGVGWDGYGCLEWTAAAQHQVVLASLCGATTPAVTLLLCICALATTNPPTHTPQAFCIAGSCLSSVQIHVLGMGDQLAEPALAERIAGTAWSRVVAIRPTGWSFKPNKRATQEGRTQGAAAAVAADPGLPRAVEEPPQPKGRTQGCVTLLGIPYSEHSSFEELRCGGGGCGCLCVCVCL